jgi:hypothetical protein
VSLALRQWLEGVQFASSVTVRLILKDICVRVLTATKSSHGVREGRPEPVQSLTERAGPLCRARNMLPSKALSGVGWMCMQPVELAA